MSEWRSYAGSPTFGRTDEPLLWFNGAGHEVRTSPAYYYNASNRSDPSHVVLQLTLDGVGFYQRKNSPRIELPAGRAFIDAIPGPHEYGWHAGRYELLFLSLHGPVAHRWMQRIHAQHGPILDFGHDESIAESLRSFVQSDPAKTLRDRYLVSGQLYGLLMQILSTLSRSRMASTPLATQALQLIEDSAPNANFNITELAAQLDTSREHLAREFKRATGISPLDYLTQKRVRHAAQELRAGSDKLERIAHLSGFSSAAYLCRVFRKSVGVTPAQFRARPWLVAP